MLRRALAFLVLLTSTGSAKSPYVPLGINYTEWGPYLNVPGPPGATQQIAADSAGALYILSRCTTSDNSPSCVTKLSADGKTIVWQNTLAFTTGRIAVDPNGNVYLIVPAPGPYCTLPCVEKLSADGGSVQWTTQLDTGASSIAVDATGRALITGGTGLIRLDSAGAIDATFAPNLPCEPIAVAVDPTGSDIVIACEMFLPYTFARLAPDNATWIPFNPPLATGSPGLAIAPNGDAVIYGSDSSGNRSLQRISPTGAVVFSESIPSPAGTTVQVPGELALDAAGNSYITGYTGALGIAVRNSLAPCGSAWLGVYAPDGSALQITYLPGATDMPVGNNNVSVYGLVAVGSGGAVFVLDQADATFTPTETGPFPQFPNGTQFGSSALYNLSPNANAQALPLACVANAASFGTGAVAPGELVALYGNSLGPQQGVQTSATLQSAFPTQAGGVEVTFDGTPGPLLWVQDSQVNVAVPWSVAGPTTQICVTYNNVKTNCLTWPVAQAAPGVFTVDGVHAAALNQDGTLNSASNPAPANTIVAVWATGLGPITPPQPDGSLVGLPLPVNAYPAGLVLPETLGLVTLPFPAPTTYLGPAPLLIAGTSQINFSSNLFISRFVVDTSLSLTVQGGADSNSFQIYVALTGGQ